MCPQISSLQFSLTQQAEASFLLIHAHGLSNPEGSGPAGKNKEGNSTCPCAVACKFGFSDSLIITGQKLVCKQKIGVTRSRPKTLVPGGSKSQGNNHPLLKPPRTRKFPPKRNRWVSKKE